MATIIHQGRSETGGSKTVLLNEVETVLVLAATGRMPRGFIGPSLLHITPGEEGEVKNLLECSGIQTSEEALPLADLLVTTL